MLSLSDNPWLIGLLHNTNSLAGLQPRTSCHPLIVTILYQMALSVSPMDTKNIKRDFFSILKTKSSRNPRILWALSFFDWPIVARIDFHVANNSCKHCIALNSLVDMSIWFISIHPRTASRRYIRMHSEKKGHFSIQLANSLPFYPRAYKSSPHFHIQKNLLISSKEKHAVFFSLNSLLLFTKDRSEFHLSS